MSPRYLLIRVICRPWLYPSAIRRTDLPTVNAGRKGDNTVEFILAGLVALGLLIYLAYALFHPDDFQ